MTDLTVIILAKNEALHIERCVTNVILMNPKQVFVVDCFSTDGTQEIATRCGATVVEREWPGLYAKQFNWALDNLPIESEWILRLDADEYLLPETIEEVKSLLSTRDEGCANGLPSDVTSLSLARAHTFCGKLIKWGGANDVVLARFFKYGIGRCQDRAMDEHIVMSEGVDYRLNGDFIDDNLNSMEWWKEKHIGYAKREAIDALAGEAFKTSKSMYYRCPPYFRAFAYFCYRYFIRLGFLDGYAGWQWHFWQGLWYRWTVDKRIQEMKRERRHG